MSLASHSGCRLTLSLVHYANYVDIAWQQRLIFSPSVALAAVNTVSNFALAIAIGHGVAIAWWRKALKGATVAELHHSWSFSASVFDVLTAGRRFNLIALTALTAKLALLDNLLLQQSAKNFAGTSTQHNATMVYPIVQKLSNNWAGQFTPNGTAGFITGDFSQVLRDYSTYGDAVGFFSDNYYQFLDSRCTGRCTAIFPGFGVTVTCDPVKRSDNYTVSKQNMLETARLQDAYDKWQESFDDAMNSNTTDLNATQTSPTPPVWSDYPELLTLESYAMIKGAQYMSDTFNGSGAIFNGTKSTKSQIVLHARWAETSVAKNSTDNETCTSQLVSRYCYLSPALVKYPVEITNASFTDSKGRPLPGSEYASNGIKMMSDPNDFQNSAQDPYLSSSTSSSSTVGFDTEMEGGQVMGFKVDREFEYDPDFDSNIQGIAYAMSSLFDTASSVAYMNGTGFYQSDENANTLLGSWYIPYLDQGRERTSCEISIPDPTNWVLSQVDSILFRASVYNAMTAIGFNSTLNETTFLEDAIAQYNNATILSDTLIYESDLRFWIPAILLVFICIMCVLPSYWGFWELGRKVTLGPMEIAGAFQAPVLHHPAVANGGEVHSLLKEVGKRKVRYGEVEGLGRLAVAEPEAVRRPTRRI
jgi:hypothetical protein